MAAFNGLTATAANDTRPDRVTQAIASASRRSGVDFSYLMGQAQIESAMNPTAQASTSSATGLYQFIDQSWLGVVKDHGAKYGLGWAANAIEKTPAGHFAVSDPKLRQQILGLRNHPETASAMAAALATDNRAYLEQHTGREPQSADLYLAHFLGAGSAAKFINALASKPDTAAASLFPAAARANRSVFYDREGNARSLADIRADFARKLTEGAQNARIETATIDHSAAYQLPANAPTVLPTDYLRIAHGGNDASALVDAAQNMAMTDPALATDGDKADDSALLGNLQAMTLGHAAQQTQSSGLPRAQAARLAYLMLATLGR